MANRYFSFPESLSRFVRNTLARASDINNRLDEVSAGFDTVQTEVDALDAAKAPKASPTFTGTPTAPNPASTGTDTTQIATTAWVQDVIGVSSVSLPPQATHSGKYLKTDGTVASWEVMYEVGDIRITDVDVSGLGYLLCNGAAYLQASYPALYSLIGQNYVPMPNTPITNPSAQPTDVVYAVSFSSDATYLASTDATAKLTVYKRSGDTFTRLADPSTPPTGATFSVDFSSDDVYVAAGSGSSPYIWIYKRSGDTFTKLSNPATLPGTTTWGVAFSPDTTYLACAVAAASPNLVIYKRSGDTFTKLSDPGALPAGTAYAVTWDPSGTYLAVGSDTTPYITIYKRSGDTFTKLSDPATLPAGGAASSADLAFDPSGTYLANRRGDVYKRSGDVFTLLVNVGTVGQSVTFSKSGLFLALGTGSGTGRIVVYRRDGDAFTQVTGLTNLPTNSIYAVEFSANDTYFAYGSNTSTYLRVYKAQGVNTATEFAVPTITPLTAYTPPAYIKAT